MKIVIFYEKPGCATNAKQKRLLQSAGCVVIERNLLEHGMSLEELSEFFEHLPVVQWFNPNAPKIKNGEIDPAQLSAPAALNLLMTEPILIRRPLMVMGGLKLCGFDQQKVQLYLGKQLNDKVSESCSAIDKPCPTPETTKDVK